MKIIKNIVTRVVGEYNLGRLDFLRQHPGWTSLSPWLSLGRLRIPAGRSRLIVRAIEKASYAVMNLSGVRLAPKKLTA